MSDEFATVGVRGVFAGGGGGGEDATGRGDIAAEAGTVPAALLGGRGEETRTIEWGDEAVPASPSANTAVVLFTVDGFITSPVRLGTGEGGEELWVESLGDTSKSLAGIDATVPS